MKTILILLTAGLVYAAAAQDASSQNKPDNAKKSTPKKVTRTPDPPTIPSDATPLPDGSFRYVDKDGKKWIYRRTPFGVSKTEERPVAPVTQNPADDPAKSEDLGDTVRFTRPTPFGPKVWTKKKAELDTWEKTIYDRDHPKSDAPSNEETKPADKSGETPKQD
jgi:hypothetical protein